MSLQLPSSHHFLECGDSIWILDLNDEAVEEGYCLYLQDHDPDGVTISLSNTLNGHVESHIVSGDGDDVHYAILELLLGILDNGVAIPTAATNIIRSLAHEAANIACDRLAITPTEDEVFAQRSREAVQNFKEHLS